MGMRSWKINTVLSLDGFRVCISGKYDESYLIAQPIMQFSADTFWKFYMKKLEILVEKMGNNPHYVYDEFYDKVSATNNMKLYELYYDKLQKTIYSKRTKVPTELLDAGRNVFKSLTVLDQAKVLLNIHQVFGRVAGGCDLSLIGGSKKEAKSKLHQKVSNWKKNYSDVRIIDTSPSGLWEKRSENILELL